MLLPIPFPLASGRYEVGPAMRRFGQAGQGFPAEEGHFQPDDLLDTTLRAKLDVLRRAPGESRLLAPGFDERGLRTAIRESFALLAAEHPAMAAVDDHGVTLRHLGIRLTGWERPVLEASGAPWPPLSEVAAEVGAWLDGQEGLNRLGDALGLAVQEDLAIVRGPEQGAPQEPGAPPEPGAQPDSGTDVLEWLHVCLPSNWAPADKVGRSFVGVHQPVVHNERLLASSAQLVRAMTHGGPFVRYVWGLHRDGALSHNPRLHREPAWAPGASPAELVRQAWFRVERQTTRGFPSLNRALFTIRYWVEPLEQVAADPWRRERIASALAGMDEAAIAYKGLTPGARDGLVQWLEGAS